MQLLINCTYWEVFHEQVGKLVHITTFSLSVCFRLVKENLELFLMEREMLFVISKPAESLSGTFSLVERDKTKAATLPILECLNFA